jgi:acyl carrier protein
MLKQDLVAFIEQNLLRGGGARIDADESLIERGLLDSMGLMRIMTFLETSTGLRIPDQQVSPDNFQSVDAIVEMVEGLRAQQSGSAARL